MASKSLDPEAFRQRCMSIGGKVFQEDDRLVCEAVVGDSSIKLVRFPDGMVSFELPKPFEQVIKKFYV